MITFAKIFVLAALWIVAFAIFVGYSKYLGSYIRSAATGTRSVQIESIVVSGNDNIAPYALTRAKELGTRLSFDQLYEVNVPDLTSNFGGKETLKLPDDAKITIQGVELSALARTFLSILPPAQYAASAKPGGADSTLQLEFVTPEGRKRSWLLRLEPTDDVKDGAAQSQPKVSKVLIDRAIYTLLHYMYYDPEGPLEWRRGAALREDFPNPRALEAFYAGRQFLANYLRTLDSAELDKAEIEFRLLQEYKPQFIDGMMLLAITLSEKRNERAAIEIYERVIGQLAKPADDHYDDWKALYQARLFRATANRKLYKWKELHLAISQLDGLINDVTNRIDNAPNTFPETEKLELRKIKLNALAERAASLPYYLILLYPAKLVEALTDPEVPPSLEVDPKTLTPDETAFRKEMDRLYKEHDKALGRARNEIETAIPGNSDKEKREKAKIESMLLAAQGYGMYRHAQVRIETELTDKEKDEAFRGLARDALVLLQKADAARPNDYLILQDMGLIYGDARYDPDGDYLENSRRLFTRSVTLKPNDYFGHQQLAALAVRHAYLWGAEFADPNVIKDGLAAANKARALRPDGARIFIALAQLHSLSAMQEGGDRAKEEAAAKLALGAAEQVKASSVWLDYVKLQAGYIAVRAAATDEVFNKAKPALETLATNLAKATSGNLNWEARKLGEIATSLGAQLSTLTFENRYALRWPH